MPITHSTPTSDLHISDRYSIGQRVIVGTFDTYAVGVVVDICITQRTYIDADGVHQYTAIDYSVKYDQYNYVHWCPHSDIRPA